MTDSYLEREALRRFPPLFTYPKQDCLENNNQAVRREVFMELMKSDTFADMRDLGLETGARMADDFGTEEGQAIAALIRSKKSRHAPEPAVFTEGA